MRAAGVPCVPGPDGALPEEPDAIRAIAREIGYPVIVKAAGGGGGRGMRVVHDEAALLDALSLTREEARRAFGNPEVYIEKFLLHPRHVEIQVLADSHGNALVAGQPRLLVAAPSPEGARRSACARHRRRADRRGRASDAPRPAGRSATAASAPSSSCTRTSAFYFIEMNTRLQVEHPVTEMTTGIDIVQQQIRVARGERLSLDAGGYRAAAATRSSAASTPRTRTPSHPRPGASRVGSCPAATACAWTATPAPAIACRPTTTRWSPSSSCTGRRATTRSCACGWRWPRCVSRASPPTCRCIARSCATTGFAAGGVDIHHLERWLQQRGAA